MFVKNKTSNRLTNGSSLPQIPQTCSRTDSIYSDSANMFANRALFAVPTESATSPIRHDFLSSLSFFTPIRDTVGFVE